MDTLYTFWDKITHLDTKSVHFWGLMNSATKLVKTLKINPRVESIEKWFASGDC